LSDDDCRLEPREPCAKIIFDLFRRSPHSLAPMGAKIATEAIAIVLHNAGFVIVPREANQKMVIAAIEAHERDPQHFGYTHHWRVMVKAFIDTQC
jgi:hypothetical protein